MTFSEQIVYAFSKPDKYKEMIELRKGRSRLFVFVMCVALAIVTFVVPTGAAIAGFGGFRNMFDKQLSSIKYSNGKLSLDHRFTLSIDNITIIIDTTNPTVKDESLRKDGMYFTIGSERATLLTTIAGEQLEYQNYSLGMFLVDGFNIDTLKKMIPFIYGYLFVTFIFTGLTLFLKYGLFAIILALLINKYNKEKKLGLSFGQLFMLCFYGQSLGMIISNFNAALGLLPQFLVSLVCVFISVRMIAMAVAMMIEKQSGL